MPPPTDIAPAPTTQPTTQPAQKHHPAPPADRNGERKFLASYAPMRPL